MKLFFHLEVIKVMIGISIFRDSNFLLKVLIVVFLQFQLISSRLLFYCKRGATSVLPVYINSCIGRIRTDNYMFV